MSFINYNAKEIHCKVVYYGPSLGGKTTNIQWIYHKTADANQSKQLPLSGENERTMMYDFVPLSVGDIRGFETRFHLFTVPGQVQFDLRRRVILKGIDGVVFVADSQAERMEENLQSLQELQSHLNQQGYDIQKIPLVFQYNKRDLPNALPLSELRATLNKYNAPDFEGIASTGKGVFETFTTVAKKVITLLKGGDV
jgi:mutual gliding-motility protein MglA